MVLKLHGTANQCSPSGLVAMVLNEKKVPFEFVPVNMRGGEYKTPEYRTRNPFYQAPYIDDDGFILYESRAICRYISTKYREQGTPLLPPAEDIEAIALFEQAVSVEAATFTSVIGAIDEMFYKTLRGLTPDQAIYNEHIATLSTRLDVYDEILVKQRYLTGDEITLADLFHLPGGWSLRRVGSDIMTTQKPNVARWFNDISSRKSWPGRISKPGDIGKEQASRL
ncbi:glutathione S-transferase [Infundibulicybe gibba]|nr:glutathione S-transferase [Infundibulicybe gibba]